MGKAASVALRNAFASDDTSEESAHTESHATPAQGAHASDLRPAHAELHVAHDTDATHQVGSQQVVSRGSYSADDTSADAADEAKDHFIVRNGVVCAGTHLIIDLFDAHQLDDLQRMENAFIDAVRVAGATLLHIHMHHFTPNGGISGVAVLAESHISVHTWPERGYAAFDVFMCGNARPELAVDVLRERFRPARVRVSELLRGAQDQDGAENQ